MSHLEYTFLTIWVMETRPPLFTFCVLHGLFHFSRASWSQSVCQNGSVKKQAQNKKLKFINFIFSEFWFSRSNLNYTCWLDQHSLDMKLNTTLEENSQSSQSTPKKWISIYKKLKILCLANVGLVCDLNKYMLTRSTFARYET